MLKNILKNLLLCILSLLIIYVACSSIVPSIKEFRHGFKSDSENVKYPGLSKQSLASHQLQQYTENLVEKKIRLRNIFIAINNQLYYSLFKKSFAENSGLIIGHHDQLFEIHYIRTYCYQTIDAKKLIEWADKIKFIHDRIALSGKKFIYIITPSKAEYMPETIPNRFHCKPRGIKQAVFTLDQLLTERNIPHINGPDLMMKATQIYRTPMFVPGGIHWNWLGSTTAASAIINALKNTAKLSIPSLTFSYTMGKVNPDESDADLLSIVKLWKSNAPYQVPQIIFTNAVYQGKPLTLSMIGGSFNESLINIFLRNKIFSKIDLYRYFGGKETYDSPGQDPVRSAVIDINTILKSDVIILEENSSMLASEHGERFFVELKHK